MLKPPRSRPPALRCWCCGIGLLVLGLAAARGAVAQDERVERWVDALASVYESPANLPLAPKDLDIAQASQVRSAYVSRLLPRAGAVTGYKAALTTAASQQHFGLTAPVYGFLTRDMLLGSGARVRRPGALQPMLEADLVVRVGSAALNTAASPMEALAALDAVMPFIELPALPYADAPSSAPAFIAANAGAWRGVLGSPVRLRANAAAAARLRNFSVVLTNGGGKEFGRGGGRTLMGDPLVVVLWLRDALRADGIRMAPGDLLSLGSLTPPVPAPWGEAVVATYTGLADAPVAVRATLDAAN